MDRDRVVGGALVQYSCPTTDFAIITWFYNGVFVPSGLGVSIVNNEVLIMDPQVSNSGIYQCSIKAPGNVNEETRAWILEVREAGKE